MSKLILWNLMTLDGNFDGSKPWELDWHHYVWGKELEAFSMAQLRSAGMLLFGRVTYQGMAGYWQKAKGEDADLMNQARKAVFSRTLAAADWNNTQLIKGDAVRTIREWKRTVEGDLFVFGSAGLITTLMTEALFDEFRIAVVPVVLGQGRPLFEPGQARTRLELLDACPMASGCVILRYKPRTDV